jgi:pimeloyl-ACP methyl ester carboxylesterase
MPKEVETGSNRTAIRPLTVSFPETELAELRRRIKATRWPERETVTDATQGVQLATIQKLAQYWSTEHDWRKCEAKLKALPNFMTEIDGLDIHFVHVRSKHENAFHLVVPSMPGYGFSGKPTDTGWGPERIARAWPALMKRLGYDKFVAQGGDWGAIITDMMGVQAPPGLLGIHTNMPCAIPPAIDAAAFTGAPPPPDLSAEERQAFDHVAFFYKHGLGYAQEMGHRPQTLYGIADSPVALAAWIIDHDIWSYKLIARIFDGQSEGLTRDDILDNITFYWLTNTGVSSARLYWQNKLAFFSPKGVAIPTVVSVFPDEICPTPRSWAEKAYPKLIYYQRHPKGGHFAAWEQPQAIVEDLRAGFAPLRKSI